MDSASPSDMADLRVGKIHLIDGNKLFFVQKENYTDMRKNNCRWMFFYCRLIFIEILYIYVCTVCTQCVHLLY
jgi:hypothetical protein